MPKISSWYRISCGVDDTGALATPEQKLSGVSPAVGVPANPPSLVPSINLPVLS